MEYNAGRRNVSAAHGWCLVDDFPAEEVGLVDTRHGLPRHLCGGFVGVRLVKVDGVERRVVGVVRVRPPAEAAPVRPPGRHAHLHAVDILPEEGGVVAALGQPAADRVVLPGLPVLHGVGAWPRASLPSRYPSVYFAWINTNAIITKRAARKIDPPAAIGTAVGKVARVVRVAAVEERRARGPADLGEDRASPEKI